MSPLPYTCLGNAVIWGKDINVIYELSIWLEQWAKAGAGPNFRVQNVSEYISNVQWVPNWIEKYFFTKFLDQLAFLIFTFLLVLVFFKKIKFNNKISSIDKKTYYFFLILAIIFLIWFFKHPTLRYGGYSIVFFLILSIPISFIFEKFENRKSFNKKFNFLIILVVVLFNIKNILRINNEIKREDLYKFSDFPYFAIDKKNFLKKNLTLD